MAGGNAGLAEAPSRCPIAGSRANRPGPSVVLGIAFTAPRPPDVSFFHKPALQK